MEVGLIKRVDIDQEMQQAYLDYAMSVIVARALPDARDGLKPVQRRILFAMQDLNLSPGSTYKKSARIVGEVLGKYHPHGDVAVYEAMARLAQDFSMRYPLVDGQGNFGSIDGDPPAAMRYTEARLTRFATELMAEIERDTVDFGDNFDGTLREPLVLPAAVPNLLVNGASGIAVGMATSIPPHNLGEVIDALSFMLEQWEHLDDLAVPDLMRFIKGPDFPTGGIILQESGENAMEAAYGSGRGRVTVRGRVHAEDLGRGRNRLIITELPYQVNKTNLIERIAELVREGDLDGIADLRDESDRQGMRIVIELKQGIEVEGILRTLYKSTPLQNTFGINLLALVDGEPRLLNLKQALRVFIEHRLTVVRRRSEFDLTRARQRAHILEGLRVALKNLDEIINLIRTAPDVEQARLRLIKRYKLSEIQAQAILDMQLRRLAALERKKIEEEYKEVTALIKELEGLLRSASRMRAVVESELMAMKQAYGDRRRTQIVSLKEGATATQYLTASDLAPTQNVWIGVTADGHIARSHGDTLPDISADRAPRHLLQASTRDTLYLLSTSGLAAAVAVSALPEAETFDAGAPLYKSSAFASEDRLASLFTISPDHAGEESRFVLAVTRQGMLKKTAFSELPGPSAQKFILIKVNQGDEALNAILTTGSDFVCLFSEKGMAIRFSEDEVRPMGLVAAGVMGIKLAEGDAVAAALLWDEKAELLLLASDGSGLRVPSADFPQQGRYGQGVIALRMPAEAHLAAVLPGTKNTAALYFTGKREPSRLRIGDAPAGKRAQKTAPLLPLKGDSLLGLTRLGEVEAIRARRAAPASDEGGKPAASAKTSPRARTKAHTEIEKPKGGKTTRPAKTAATTVKAAKATPTKVAVTKSAAAKPAVSKPTAAKKAAEEPAVRAKPTQPGSAKPAPRASAAAQKKASQPTTAKTSVAKAASGKPAPAQPAKGKPAVGKPTPPQPAKGKPAVGKPTPPQPARGKPAKSTPAASGSSRSAATPVEKKRGAKKPKTSDQEALPGLEK